uniref:EF-hand domain-containing protein n=1 Tax=Ciona savignyi TaxID=51511 RepID=H2ZNH3_CIOSA
MHLLFNVFDLNKTGYLTLQQFKDMFRCMVDTFSSIADQAAVEEVLNKIVPLQLDQEDGQLNFAEFKNLLCQLELDKIVLPFNAPEKKSKSPLKRKVSKHDRVQQARKLYENKTPLNSLTEQNENTSEARAVVLEVSSRLRSVRRWFECYARHVFWVSFYCWITLGVFLWSFNAVNSKKS